MKICVSSVGNTLDSILDKRFGRAAYFVIADTDTMQFKSIENGAAQASGGAGISSAQAMIDNGVEAVITGNVGPNALNVLKEAKIKIFRGEEISVKENIEKFKQGQLQKLDSAVSKHFGMKI